MMKTKSKMLGDRAKIVANYGLRTIGNQEPYFSVTGTLYDERGRDYMGGCIHEEIAEHMPELSDLIELHLCSRDGVPMHAEENGFYWLTGAIKGVVGCADHFGARYHPGNSTSVPKSPGECVDILAQHLRIPRAAAVCIVDNVCNEARRYDMPRQAEVARESFKRHVDALRNAWKASADAAVAKHGLEAS